jgi:hypothetical protein
MNITLQWSKEMNRKTTESAFSSSPLISCVWSWIGANQTCFHKSPFDLDTKYSITIGGYASDISNIPMMYPYLFQFSTSPPPDKQPPYIVATIPKGQAQQVPIDAGISFRWSEDMDRSSAQGAFSSSPAVACTWAWNGVNQTCIPSTSLQYGTSYTINLSTEAKDLAGNSMDSRFSFSFITAQPPDTKPPTVVGTKPSDGETEVDATSKIIITFSERMNESATENAISIYPGLITNKEWDGSRALLILTVSFENGTRYTVKISTGASDFAGNKMASEYAFSFTTKGYVTVDPTFFLIFAIIVILLLFLLLMRRRKQKALPGIDKVPKKEDSTRNREDKEKQSSKNKKKGT